MYKHDQKPLIAASLLACDFAKMGEEVAAMDAAGVDMFHLDIMDGHFVPNLTFGPAVIKALRKYTTKTFDAHLMVQDPQGWLIDTMVDAGADIITVHVEACPNLRNTLKLIKSKGKKAGVALNPTTSPALITPVLKDIDMILVMTINPGFGGQKLMPEQIDKVKEVRAISQVQIEVDGGINPTNAAGLIDAGADIIVAGTALFSDGKPAYASNIKKLKRSV